MLRCMALPGLPWSRNRPDMAVVAERDARFQAAVRTWLEDHEPLVGWGQNLVETRLPQSLRGQEVIASGRTYLLIPDRAPTRRRRFTLPGLAVGVVIPPLGAWWLFQYVRGELRSAHLWTDEDLERIRELPRHSGS